jgi:hypothetical protein
MRLSAALPCLLVACACGEPVLQGVPEQRLLAEPAAAPDDDAPVDAAARSANPELYEKPDHIYVDANWIGGRSFREARGIVQQQLGSLQATEALPSSKGDELRFERGTLRVLDDRIYYVLVPLPEPSRRDLALADLGFQPVVGEWLATHRAYRLNHERGYRRLRLLRLDAEGEFVTAVEAWKWIPGEHGARR